MRCEVCGRKIHGAQLEAMIEGARLTVCLSCSKHGKIVVDEPKPTAATIKSAPRSVSSFQPSKAPEPTVDTSTELIETYGNKIRQAREKLGLSHEELGRRLNEKVSLLRKIETGRMAPNNTLATRLERALRIKLVVPASEEKAPAQTRIPRDADQELTLGDLMNLDGNQQKGRQKNESNSGSTKKKH